MNRLSQTIFNRSYVSSTSPLAETEGSLAKGSSNVLLLNNGQTQTYRGPTQVAAVNGGRAMYQSPTGHASLGDGTNAGIGSVVGLIANAIAYVGTGPLYINGVTRSVSASTTPQIILYRVGSYSGASTGPYVLGLTAPSAPTLANTPTVSTIMSGSYSTTHWFVRSQTGGRSRRSSISAVIVNTGFKMRHTVAAGDLTTASTNGYDRLGIGVTQAGFGASGPHYEEREIAISSLTVVDGVADSVELEWSDASLVGQPLAPIDDFPPPPCVFLAAIEDTLAAIGCYGDSTSGVSATTPGSAIAVSLPVLIESFPPDSLLFLPEPPKGVLSRAGEGFVYIGCANSMHALFYKGGEQPLGLRTIWPTTGIQAQHNMWLGEGGRLYAFTSERGLARVGEDGQPEHDWSREVVNETSTWTPSAVVGGYDDKHQLNIIGHATTLLAYNAQIDEWCAPLSLSGLITGTLCACVTVNGSLLLAATDGATIRLYNFNAGTGTLGEYVTPWRPSQNVDEVFQVKTLMRSDNTNTVTIKVFTNGDRTTAVTTKTVTPVSGLRHLPVQKINVRGARSHCVSVSHTSSGGDAGVDIIETLGVTSRISL